ncbi:hypothetical protein AB0J40_01700 [Amycolatopsis sp. NPDC049691]|uniref:hypothetical protein n=1 Tax=Amycolatopsis sp. NPDC049691 TaxID=3155155 RepID=UPI003449318B
MNRARPSAAIAGFAPVARQQLAASTVQVPSTVEDLGTVLADAAKAGATRHGATAGGH